VADRSAEHALGPEAARALIRATFPGVAAASVAPFGEGFDNAVFLVDGDKVSRFPRRRLGRDGMAVERRVLPALRGRLPLPTPDLRWIGPPSAIFPAPFAGYPLLPGRALQDTPLDRDARARLAGPLGRFLRVLHAHDAGAAAALGAPADDFRGDLPARRARSRRRLEGLARLEPATARRLADLLDARDEVPRSRRRRAASRRSSSTANRHPEGLAAGYGPVLPSCHGPRRRGDPPSHSRRGLGCLRGGRTRSAGCWPCRRCRRSRRCCRRGWGGCGPWRRSGAARPSPC